MFLGAQSDNPEPIHLQAKMYECICFCNLLPPDCPAIVEGPEGNPTAFTGQECVWDGGVDVQLRKCGLHIYDLRWIRPFL